MHEWEAQILTPSLPAAETPFPQSTSVASKMTGLLKTKKKKKGKKSKSGSQIAICNVLPQIRNELLWFCRSDQECSGKIPIKANLPQWQNFGQLLVPLIGLSEQ